MHLASLLARIELHEHSLKDSHRPKQASPLLPSLISFISSLIPSLDIIAVVRGGERATYTRRSLNAVFRRSVRGLDGKILLLVYALPPKSTSSKFDSGGWPL
jgi:hypothetical protein